ncbi:hypothetical protein [Pseudomonas asiatica]|uniref:hypothetical protein n=1 Tax=Pseudomonas asiatica TaxID=2219225 RepID=UPI0018AC2D0F|nr:hypothetical protein [Pseudomonas asiatica]MBF8805755.1 hypothetical protein [Pseudomonas asiatica]
MHLDNTPNLNFFTTKLRRIVLEIEGMLFDTFAAIKYRAGASITKEAAPNPNTTRCKAKQTNKPITETTSQGNFKLFNK